MYRLGAASKEAYVEDSFPSVLHRYLTFDDEMSVVGSVYIDCQMRLDQLVSSYKLYTVLDLCFL